MYNNINIENHMVIGDYYNESDDKDYDSDVDDKIKEILSELENEKS